jgi:hypothetical protein
LASERTSNCKNVPREFQRIPKDSRGFQRILEDSRGFQRIPEDSREFQRIHGGNIQITPAIQHYICPVHLL